MALKLSNACEFSANNDPYNIIVAFIKQYISDLDKTDMSDNIPKDIPK